MNYKPMNDSLGQRTSTFKDLQWTHVLTLVDLLLECDLNTSHHIEKRYRERGAHFTETLAFLVRIGLVKQLKGALVLQEQFLGTHNANVHFVVLNRLVFSKSRYSSEAARYLTKYTLTGAKVSYRSNERVRSEESAVRNFLMEMGVIAYVRHEDNYVVSPEHLNFYVQMREKSLHCSPLRITTETEARDEIGLAAEKAVVDSEKERVGQRLSHYIQHVALRNAAAGYDILSVAAETPTDTTARYIEVKAVSSTSFQFYWTQNEVQVARLLGPLYYLYLVPIESDCDICRDRFVIISNPYADVLGSVDKWIVKSDVLLCRPRSSQALQDRLVEA